MCQKSTELICVEKVFQNQEKPWYKVSQYHVHVLLLYLVNSRGQALLLKIRTFCNCQKDPSQKVSLLSTILSLYPHLLFLPQTYIILWESWHSRLIAPWGKGGKHLDIWSIRKAWTTNIGLYFLHQREAVPGAKPFAPQANHPLMEDWAQATWCWTLSL